MIYILSEPELSALSLSSDFNINSLSPFSGNLKGKNYLNDIETLIDLHLLRNDVGDYVFTDEGRLLSEIIFRPEAVACIGKRKDKNNLYYLCKKEGLWVIYTYSAELNAYIMWSFFTTDILSKWLKGNIYAHYEIDITSSTSLNLELSYREWYVFLLSQLLFMKRQLKLSKPLIGDDCCFDLDSLIDPENINYLKSGFKDYPIHAEIIDKFSRQDGIENIKPLILQLAKKNIFTLKNDKLTYTDMAVEWLDNGLLVDTIFFNYRKINSLDYTMLFSLRRNGITALYEDENTVRLISSTNIPWEIYLK